MTTSMPSPAQFARRVDEDQNLLTREEAATIAGVTRPTIDYWTSRGYLPVLKFGRATRIETADLRKLMDLRAKSPGGKLPRTPQLATRSNPGEVTITLTAEQVAQVTALLRVTQGAAK